ncbi:hypothetical protein BSKO_08340 [Bryopsis sp. KO-2023]|nr:hypothetical protein BSKO_08340 [Bryopsis sp. KO-2023]
MLHAAQIPTSSTTNSFGIRRKQRGGAKQGRICCSRAAPERQRDSSRDCTVDRRSTLGLGACIATYGFASALLPPASEASDLATRIPQGYEFGTVQDTTLAYEFAYPKQTLSGKKLAIFVSKKPTRYSSVTPMSADAEQRIVCQVADFKNNVFASISVCRPPGVLMGRDPSEWRSGEVAQAILNDRSVGRNSLGRRSFMGQLEGTGAEMKDGDVYWQYESIIQGSPTPTDSSRETFRHQYSVTSVRPGQNGEPYLYTLNVSCPEEIWDDLGPLLGACITSFRLTTPVKGYVPPDVTPLLPF